MLAGAALLCGPRVPRAPGSRPVVVLDVDATLVALARALPVRSLTERLSELFRPEPEPAVVPLHYTLDSERARTWLTRLGERLHRDPVNARLDVVRHRRIEAAPGRE